VTISIQAKSIAPAVEGWLRETTSARVLHVFEPVCNLINSKGHIISIVIPQIGNGPFGLIIPQINFTDILESKSAVRIINTSFSIGLIEISTGGCKIWQPSPDWEKLRSHRDRLKTSAKLIEDLLVEEAPNDSFARISTLISTSHNIPTEVYKAGKIGIAQLSKALDTMDTEQIIVYAEQLAGLGSGLTPAGDDFLMGVMHALWAILPEQRAEQLSGEIAEAASPLTASLSAAWLRAAAHGEAGERWHELFDAIIYADGDKFLSAARRILPTGHSSGADALGGFSLAIRILAR
jgi:hypothetical protein